MVLPLLLGLAAPLIGGAISAFGASAKERAQQRAQEEYLAEYDVYRRNVESTPQITTHATTRGVDFAGMVRAAEAAGFNPMTVLKMGGLAAYTNENTVITAPKLWVAPAPREGFSPGGAGAMAFGQSVSSIDLSSAYANVAQANLANAQASMLHRTPSTAGMGHVAAMRSGGGRVTGPLLAPPKYEPNPVRFGGPLTPEIDTPSVVNPWPGGWGVNVDPNTPNAEWWENRYGELIGGLAGTGVVGVQDFKHNAPSLWQGTKDFIRQYTPDMLIPWVIGGSGKQGRLVRQ